MTAPAPQQRPPGQLRQGWQRLRRNRSGMLGLILIALVVAGGGDRAVARALRAERPVGDARLRGARRAKLGASVRHRSQRLRRADARDLRRADRARRGAGRDAGGRADRHPGRRHRRLSRRPCRRTADAADRLLPGDPGLRDDPGGGAAVRHRRRRHLAGTRALPQSGDHRPAARHCSAGRRSRVWRARSSCA